MQYSDADLDIIIKSNTRWKYITIAIMTSYSYHHDIIPQDFHFKAKNPIVMLLKARTFRNMFHVHRRLYFALSVYP